MHFGRYHRGVLLEMVEVELVCSVLKYPEFRCLLKQLHKQRLPEHDVCR